ncbi:hypothetical protein [Polyangium spumosum]|uniref:Uncharacterized protein n=1 Tax=Polyangium spumosum TaxID=889282 RepID=A0A6N7Q7K5_9BACT|nr:hypothetical protein [Polyangium spumosum]MRG98284.1 hypothetical protein [Polyangium spumosum]
MRFFLENRSHPPTIRTRDQEEQEPTRRPGRRAAPFACRVSPCSSQWDVVHSHHDRPERTVSFRLEDLMSAQPINPMDEDDPTVVCASSVAPPASGVRSSAPPEEKRDTWLDPQCAPPVPWPRRALDFVFAILAFIAGAPRRARERLAARLNPPPLASVLPPPPFHRKGELSHEQIGEILLHNLFRLSPAYLDAAEHVLYTARLVQRLPSHERVLAVVHFAVTRLCATARDPVPIAWVRARIPEVRRSDLNRALEQLEEQQAIALYCLETNDPREVSLGISNPVRGCLTHIELRRPL